jgi:DNA-binding GntR family transcriptional regulator
MADHRLYIMVYEDLRDQILSGKYEPGAHLPSISELTRTHEISRQTAGKAFRMLAKAGLTERVPGLGWYVADPLPEQAQ